MFIVLFQVSSFALRISNWIGIGIGMEIVIVIVPSPLAIYKYLSICVI